MASFLLPYRSELAVFVTFKKEKKSRTAVFFDFGVAISSLFFKDFVAFLVSLLVTFKNDNDEADNNLILNLVV